MRELRRIILNRATAFVLVLLTLIGCFLFIITEKQRNSTNNYEQLYTPVYHKLIEEYKAEAPEYAIEQLNLRIEALYGEFSDDANRAAIDACGNVIKQLEHIAWFNDYYPSIVRNAERMKHTQLFGSTNSFAYKNILKTVEDFKAIDGAVGALGDDRGITRLFSDSITDYLILIFMAYICVMLLQERKSGLWHLVRALPNGRSRLAISRLIALFICSALSVLFIFYGRVIISYTLYDGAAYGSRLVQSVIGFSGITFPISINNYILLYGLIKTLCTFAASVLIWLLLSSYKNINISLGITAIVLVAEFGLYTAIRDNSILVPFKYFNIFQIIEPANFMINYLNLEICGLLINVRTAVTSFTVAVTAFAIVGCILLQCHKRPGGMPNPIESLIDKIRKLTYRFVFLQEVWKILIPQRGIIVFVIVILIATSFGELPSTSATPEQRHIQEYYAKYAGRVDESTIKALDAEIAELSMRIEESNNPALERSLSSVIDGLDSLKYEVYEIINLNASGEYPREILLTPPYTYLGLFGENSYDMQVSQGLKATFLICLLSYGLYAYERQSFMGKLLKSLPKGGAMLIIKKTLILLTFSAIVFAAVYLPELVAAADKSYYGGFLYFNYPVQGLKALRHWHISLSIGGFTIVVYIIRFIVIFILSNFAALIGGISKKVNSAAILAAAIIILPVCLVAMGVDVIYPFTALIGLGFTYLLF